VNNNPLFTEQVLDKFYFFTHIGQYFLSVLIIYWFPVTYRLATCQRICG